MSTRIDLSLGNLYALVDDDRDWTLPGGSLWVAPHTMPPGRGRLVHIMSPAAGGEIEAYVLDSDKRLHVRRPNRVPWPQLDAAVADALGATITTDRSSP